mmetsp:Transcript_91455/g.167858  ORF Transcript_91455/g.167858 Transcript_91455/m.167858 type:complete len:239 (-) Transcript_91455:2113-2829(-)
MLHHVTHPWRKLGDAVAPVKQAILLAQLLDLLLILFNFLPHRQKLIVCCICPCLGRAALDLLGRRSQVTCTSASPQLLDLLLVSLYLLLHFEELVIFWGAASLRFFRRLLETPAATFLIRSRWANEVWPCTSLRIQIISPILWVVAKDLRSDPLLQSLTPILYSGPCRKFHLPLDVASRCSSAFCSCLRRQLLRGHCELLALRLRAGCERSGDAPRPLQRRLPCSCTTRISTCRSLRL